MSFFQTFLMWFPPCAMFVALAWVTEFAWREEKQKDRFGKMRRVIYQEDGAPLCFEDENDA